MTEPVGCQCGTHLIGERSLHPKVEEAEGEGQKSSDVVYQNDIDLLKVGHDTASQSRREANPERHVAV